MIKAEDNHKTLLSDGRSLRFLEGIKGRMWSLIEDNKWQLQSVQRKIWQDMLLEVDPQASQWKMILIISKRSFARKNKLKTVIKLMILIFWCFCC
jgi:hypothetical protein